jgi:NADH-quinone oxidoreductase subunit C
MTNEEIKSTVTALLPTATFEDPTLPTGWLTIHIESKDILYIMQSLHDDANSFFDYLFCLTCIDWKTHLTMVYHLSSTRHRHNIVIKIKLDRNNPEIESLSHIWKTAEFHEREVYEMFGVKFLNHPDLRLLILPDGWEGKNPLRKDFEDPVNMIKL